MALLSKLNCKRGTKTKKSKFNIFGITNKIASSMFIFNIFFVNLIPISIENNLTTNEAGNTQSNIVFSVEKASPVLADFSRNKIIPGDSLQNKNDRAVEEAKRKEAEKLVRDTIARESRVYSDPSNFDEIYAQAEAMFGVDARILKAIHTVETGASGSTSRSSYAGAQGPMQFLPSTWRKNGVDGNGDGIADIANVNDAIFSAAHYLKACGYPNLQKALWGYNPSTYYYNKVMRLAGSFGYSQ